MNKLDRQKFDNLKSGDTIWYLDDTGCQCEGVIVGWRNSEGQPAALCGQHGSRVVALAQVLSRTRGNDTKEWPRSCAT